MCASARPRRGLGEPMASSCTASVDTDSCRRLPRRTATSTLRRICCSRRRLRPLRRPRTSHCHHRPCPRPMRPRHPHLPHHLLPPSHHRVIPLFAVWLLIPVNLTLPPLAPTARSPCGLSWPRKPCLTSPPWPTSTSTAKSYLTVWYQSRTI